MPVHTINKINDTSRGSLQQGKPRTQEVNAQHFGTTAAPQHNARPKCDVPEAVVTVLRWWIAKPGYFVSHAGTIRTVTSPACGK